MEKRAVNFTKEEEYLLISLVEKYKSIIENKKSEATTWREKEKVWISLEEEFNSANKIKRNAKTLKEKYRNLKKKTKAKYAESKREMNQTGGGKYVPPLVTDIEEAIKNIIGEEQISGLKNGYDCDSKDVCVLPSVEPSSPDNLQVDIVNEDTEMEVVENVSYDILVDVKPQESEDVLKVDILAREDTFKLPTVGFLGHASKSNIEKAEETKSQSSCSDWTSYSTKDLKTPIAKKLQFSKTTPSGSKVKLQTQVQNRVTKRYQNLNAQLIEKKLEFVKLQKQKFLEEHELKMQILKLKLEKLRNEM